MLLIYIYMILNGIGSTVPIMLRIGFSLLLFEQDRSGISAAYLEPASLLGIGCAGCIGGLLFDRFVQPIIGVGSLLLAILVLLCLLLYGQINVHTSTLTLWALACIMSIEHSNGLAFISKHIRFQDKPFFFSTFQFFLQCFNVLAPIVAKYLVMCWGMTYFLLICICIYTLRMVPWWQFHSMRLGHKDINDSEAPYGMLTGFKEIIINQGLLCMTIFRIINNMVSVAYTTSVPILVAKLANGDPEVNAKLHPYNESIIHLGFIVSGIWGSYLLKRKPKMIIYFFKINPILLVFAASITFYIVDPFYLQTTALLYGMSSYLFRTATSIMAQALTQKEKLAHVILAGDAVVKFFGYGIGSFIPSWIALPTIWGIMPLSMGCVLSFLLSLPIMKPIVKIYLASLYKENNTK